MQGRGEKKETGNFKDACLGSEERVEHHTPLRACGARTHRFIEEKKRRKKKKKNIRCSSCKGFYGILYGSSE